jgi:hypothetical protein
MVGHESSFSVILHMKSEIAGMACKRSSKKPSKKALMAHIRGLARNYMNTARGSDESKKLIQQMVAECKQAGLDQQNILNSVADEMRKEPVNS